MVTPHDAGPRGVPADMQHQFDQILAELRHLRDLVTDRRKPVLTVDEVAREVGRDPYTIRTWIKAGRLSATRVAGTGPKGRLLVRREELNRLISRGCGGSITALSAASSAGEAGVAVPDNRESLSGGRAGLAACTGS